MKVGPHLRQPRPARDGSSCRPADLLVHAGDFTRSGKPGQAKNFLQWFAAAAAPPQDLRGRQPRLHRRSRSRRVPHLGARQLHLPRGPAGGGRRPAHLGLADHPLVLRLGLQPPPRRRHLPPLGCHSRRPRPPDHPRPAGRHPRPHRARRARRLRGPARADRHRPAAKSRSSATSTRPTAATARAPPNTSMPRCSMWTTAWLTLLSRSSSR